MQQIYHTNAATNVHIRRQIQDNFLFSNEKLAAQFGISPQTVSKWKNRDFQTDVSCRPKNIEYALSELQQVLIVCIRKITWFSLDEVFEMLSVEDETITRSSVYRCLKRNGMNKAPEAEKEKLKKFKEYEPGFLHIDVTHLPKINDKKHYLFVAIDRATRTLFYEVYEDKTALSTQNFFDKCVDFFPFKITHILTDNGLEFTNKLLKSKTGKPCQKPSLLDERCAENNIDHRLTLPATPKTNGMVERANGIIKQATVVKNEYHNKEEMEDDLMRFLVFYNLHRRHGSLRKELNVKTPFEATEKWFKLKPEIFKINPVEFKNKILLLKTNLIQPHQQRCET
jgi:transposase-like protein